MSIENQTPDLKPAAHGLKPVAWASEHEKDVVPERVMKTHRDCMAESGLSTITVQRYDIPLVKLSDVLPLLSPPRAGMTEAEWGCLERLCLCEGVSMHGSDFRRRCGTCDGCTVRTAAYRLLMEQIQGPCEWTAETFPNIPNPQDWNFERRFRVRFTGRPNYDMHLEGMPSVMLYFERGIIDAAFGPFAAPPDRAPQPPEKQP